MFQGIQRKEDNHVNWTIIWLSQSLSIELQVYPEIQRKDENQVKFMVVKNITLIGYRNVNKYEIGRKLITHCEMDFNVG